MGRHSDGKDNYSVSKGLIFGIIALIAVIALVWWWVAARASNDEQRASSTGECIQGELSFGVFEQTSGQAATQVEAFNQAGHIIRDYCVRAELVDSIEQAAVYIAPDSPSLAIERSISSITPIGVVQAGVAAEGDSFDPASVNYPVAESPDASVAVATSLLGEAAPDTLRADLDLNVADVSAPMAVLESQTPEGLTFNTVKGGDIAIAAHVLTPTDTVSEEQIRAGAEFAKLSQSNVVIIPDRGPAWLAVISEDSDEDSAEDSADSADISGAEDTNAQSDTLLLLDTSAAMNEAFGGGSLFSASARSMSQVSLDLGDAGHQVGLWNYSSPLNPGVTQGWRSNVSFGDSLSASQAVLRFGTGGVPQTRSAVVAATAYAAEQARTTGQPARVLVVTSGTVNDMDDAQFASALSQAKGDAQVVLSVVHVGSGPLDPALAAAANSTVSVKDPAELDPALRGAVGL